MKSLNTFVREIFRVLSRKVGKLSYLPKWVIFAVDLFIVLFCGLMIWEFTANVGQRFYGYFTKNFLLVLVVYAVFQLISGVHYSIVRYSTVRDLYKVFKVNFLSFSFLLIFTVLWNQLQVRFFPDLPLNFSIFYPLVTSISVLCLQITYRLSVRLIFESAWSRMTGKAVRKSLIFGTDSEAVGIAKAQRSDATSTYKPEGFISTDPTLTKRSQIINMPVIPISQLREFIAENEIKVILMSASKISEFPKTLFDDLILDRVKLKKVNLVTGLNDQSHVDVSRIRIEDLLGRSAIDIDRDRLFEQFRDTTVLITGAAGSIGSEIANQVCSYPCSKVLLLDQAETPLNDLWLELLGKKIPNLEIIPIVASVWNEPKMRQVFENYHPSLVFHAAAYKHVPMMELHPCTAIMTNVAGTKTVADLSSEFGVKRFVMVSTDKAVNPTNVMGATKRAAEIYIQSLFYQQQKLEVKNPCQFVTTRFGNVLGSNGSVVPLFKKQIEHGGPITLTHRDIIRYFMSIPEACSLVLEAGSMGNGGEVYVFDMGDAVRIYNLAEKMIRLSGKTPGKDIQIVETGLRPGEKLYEELLTNAEETLPTYHPKVMIAQVKRYEFEEVMPLIDRLIEDSSTFDDIMHCVSILKELVPEFKSQNSQFEVLDQK